jgi:hypothetical protein
MQSRDKNSEALAGEQSLLVDEVDMRGSFKYGYIGFCVKTRKPVKYTIDNVLLCRGCRFFRDKKGGV